MTGDVAATWSVPVLGGLREDDLQTALEHATQLLIDVWRMGQFAGAVNPQEWPSRQLARPCPAS
ncbi:hypothetical protein GCM10010112_91550 [Actinoplanes lobatus]|uniref:Uncharacterized protein n=1 Tax=Actinoplanes lobatus TaxID=113568 RepID=A0ABQ4AYK5_9ACTN|nr:hypothetical protein GCM10010112_91550 [Actinoplanes lobatus]GIE46098.1 hypothetical protein Alo02nite_89960 [Actinoplanes lobatus]